MLAAARDGNLELLREELKTTPAEAVRTTRDEENGNTALLWAVQNKHVECVKELLRAGADPNDRTEYAPGRQTNYRYGEGMPALHVAHNTHSHQAPLLMKLLVEAGADVNSLYIITPILVNVAGVSNHQWHDYDFQACFAALQVSPSGSQLNLNVADSLGKTALHLSIRNSLYIPKDRDQRVKVLLEAGAAPNQQDKNGNTPLHLAVLSTNALLSIQYLIEHGAHTVIRNTHGLTPRDYCDTEEKLAVLNGGRAPVVVDAVSPEQRDEQLIAEQLAQQLDLNDNSTAPQRRGPVRTFSRSDSQRSHRSATPAHIDNIQQNLETIMSASRVASRQGSSMQHSSYASDNQSPYLNPQEVENQPPGAADGAAAPPQQEAIRAHVLQLLERNFTCRICLDLISVANCWVSCGHVFCGTCTAGWLGSNCRATCPACRTAATAPPVRLLDVDELIQTNFHLLDEETQQARVMKIATWDTGVPSMQIAAFFEASPPGSDDSSSTSSEPGSPGDESPYNSEPSSPRSASRDSVGEGDEGPVDGNAAEATETENERNRAADEDLLLQLLTTDLVFDESDEPDAAILIFRCCLQWEKFSEEQRFDNHDRSLSLFDRIHSAMREEVDAAENDNDRLGYWLSNLAALVHLHSSLLRCTAAFTFLSSAGITQTIEAKLPAGRFVNNTLFLASRVVHKLYENSIAQIQPHLNACLIVSDDQEDAWKAVVEACIDLYAALNDNQVPEALSHLIFEKLFSYMNVELFNTMTRLSTYSFDNASHVAQGLAKLEFYLCEGDFDFHARPITKTPKFPTRIRKCYGFAWENLAHIRQAIDFITSPWKKNRSVADIREKVCPALTAPQIYRLITLVGDSGHTTFFSDELKQQLLDQAKVHGYRFELGHASRFFLLLNTKYFTRDDSMLGSVHVPAALCDNPRFEFLTTPFSTALHQAIQRQWMQN